MTEPLACITVTSAMPDFRPCTIRDEHYLDYPDMDTHLRHCNGCKPRQARVGMVCNSCYARIEEAVALAGPWFDMLKGVDHAVRRDAVGGRKQGPGVPIAPVPLTFDEIESYYRSFTGTAERWVASRQGAEDAVRFARAMHSAVKNHPTAETAHKIRRTRCQGCEQLTLVWNPPQFFGGFVLVKCKDPECGWEADQTSFEKIADIEKPEKTKKEVA